jgi:hypothetical protein
MPKLVDESAVELLMEHAHISAEEAWDIVLQRIQNDKENEPEKEPAEKKQKFLIVEDPNGKVPDDLLVYTATCHPTPVAENGAILEGEYRKWGLGEVHTILDAIRRKAINDDKGSRLIDLAGKRWVKELGVSIAKEPLLLVPTATTRIFNKVGPHKVTNVEVSCD